MQKLTLCNASGYHHIYKGNNGVCVCVTNKGRAGRQGKAGRPGAGQGLSV